jgi:hypothetical protein
MVDRIRKSAEAGITRIRLEPAQQYDPDYFAEKQRSEAGRDRDEILH